MKVQQIQQVKYNQNNERLKETNPQFKGAVDTVLRFLATNQGVGANLTDICFMVAPRTISDARRGPAACAETLRREASGTANHSLVGVYGAVAGSAIALAMGLNGKYGVKTNKILAAPETFNILAENKANQIKNNKSQLDYLKETLSRVKGFNPDFKDVARSVDENGFVALSEETINEVATILDKVISDKDISFNKWDSKKEADSFYTAMNKIISDTGAESKFILQSADGKESKTTLKALLEDIFKVSESFNKKEVKTAFEEQIRNNKSIAENRYIKSLTKFNKTKAAACLAIASAVGMSIQPLNIYLTKKKTGSDGFVGVEGRQKDRSAGFFALKTAASAGFAGLTLATLGTGLKGFMNKMAITGIWPTISQLKGIYGLTIISRLMATRDKDELRESLTKDTLGYLSWLVLGDIVNKSVAEKLDNSVMNRTKDIADKKFFSRVFNSTLKTRDEVLIEELKKFDSIELFKKTDKGEVAKTFNELMKELKESKVISKEAKKAIKKRLGTLNKAQGAGYLFSGLILGFGIPNLNIFITNRLDKKRKEKALEEASRQAEQEKNMEAMNAAVAYMYSQGQI